jgi:hypothetical protein
LGSWVRLARNRLRLSRLVARTFWWSMIFRERRYLRIRSGEDFPIALLPVKATREFPFPFDGRQQIFCAGRPATGLLDAIGFSATGRRSG